MNSEKKQQEEHKAKTVKKKKPKKKIKSSVWKKEYKRILEENASAIKGYNWQQSSGGVKNVSMVDINGDGIKELFFMKLQKMQSSMLLKIQG